jgi:hypothetical protein
MLVNPISLSGRCSVIAPRLPPTCRRSVLHLLEPSGPAHGIRASPRSIDYRVAVLFRVSLLDQGGPPTAARARWRPVAAAAPCLRHRSGGPPPLSAQHRQDRQPEQEATRPVRAPGPGRHSPSTTTPLNDPPSKAAWPQEPQCETGCHAVSATARTDRGADRDAWKKRG